jgi:outer membrane receptor protein involved in Fe transport
MKPSRLVVLALAGAAIPVLAAAAPAEVSPVEVIALTPLSGPVDASTTPAPVQTLTGEQIARSHALDLTAVMNRTLGSVYINDIQNNPLQPDVNYRGFTASPLLGTPQGLSVYLDGARLNQPFGDVVSWDLIPRAAIASVTLAPGSDPLFGLNTLGGALSIRTKDGHSAPGSAVQLGYGSNRRQTAEFETGGSAANGLDWYVTGAAFKEDGWREASPSKASQLFAKLGWGDGRTDLHLAAALADTDLTGNGLQEQRLLSRDYDSVYTKPDNTRNRSGLLNFTATHRFSDHLSFSGDAYYRRIDTRTLNGDINDDSFGASVYQPTAAEQAALRAAGYLGFPTAGETAANTPFPSWRCIANVLLNSEPNEKCNGLLNRTATRQTDAAASGQFTLDSSLAGRHDQLTAGAAYHASRARFIQSSQFGYLTPGRGVATVAGPGAFADGTQDSEDAHDARVDLAGRTRTWSIYASNILELAPALNLTLSGRYDDTQAENRDALIPAGPGSLTGDHHFSRFNPAVGVTYSPRRALTAYAGYNEGSRAPSAIELGCADPDNPCRLPNSLAGDPPLKQVIARTLEAGLRGTISTGAFKTAWNAGVFRTDNIQDIMFVADDTSGFGYFKNFGKTRRQGVEVGFSGGAGAVSFGANYTFLDATYQSREVVGGEGNSSNDAGLGFEGAITVRPGDRIPLVPQHIFKANARWDVRRNLSIEADMIAVGSSYARGDENNQHAPDGVFYLGPGKSPGYAVFNLGADYRPTRALKLFVQVNNLFDSRYYSAAQLGSTGFDAQGGFVARPFNGPVIGGERPALGATFYAPGAPREISAGLRYAFGG